MRALGPPALLEATPRLGPVSPRTDDCRLATRGKDTELPRWAGMGVGQPSAQSELGDGSRPWVSSAFHTVTLSTLVARRLKPPQTLTRGRLGPSTGVEKLPR